MYHKKKHKTKEKFWKWTQYKKKSMHRIIVIYSQKNKKSFFQEIYFIEKIIINKRTQTQSIHEQYTHKRDATNEIMNPKWNKSDSFDFIEKYDTNNFIEKEQK